MQPVEIMGALVAPSVLISAAALVLLSTANRLGRVNDRLLHLTAEAERADRQKAESPAAKEKGALTLAQLESLLERLFLLRSAVTSIYVTIALFVMAGIAGGLYVAFPGLTALFPVSVGLFGAVAFLYSLVLLIREALLAVRVTLAEIAYTRRLLDADKLN